MEMNQIIPIACLAGTAVVCEMLKWAGFWQIGAAEIYEKRDIALDACLVATFLAPDWLKDWLTETASAAVNKIKTLFTNIASSLSNLFNREG